MWGAAKVADGTGVKLVTTALLGVAVLFAADAPPGPAEQAARIRAAMEASVARQRASVQLQVQKAQAQGTPSAQAPSGFFTVPWPEPPSLVSTPVADCDPLPASELDPLVDASAKKHGVKGELVRAVIRKESGGRPCAVSPKGAQGLMQLMPGTAVDLSVDDPFDPKENVDAGTRLLKSLLDRYRGDLSLVLGAYNAGAGAVEKQGGVPQNAETQDYVREILKSLTSGSGSP